MNDFFLLARRLGAAPRRTALALGLLFGCALFGPGCAPAGEARSRGGDAGGESGDSAEEHAHEDGHGHEDELHVPARARENLGLEFDAVVPRQLERVLRIPGAFELEPRARRELHLALSGRIELAVDHLESVEPGQLLYRLQSPEWPELLHEIVTADQQIATATAAIEVAEARAAEAQARLEIIEARLAALAEADFRLAELEAQAADLRASAPRLAAELDAAHTELANARRGHDHALHRASTAGGVSIAALEHSEEAHEQGVFESLQWIDVRAPEAGIVEHLDVTDGAFAEASTRVLSIVQPERVRLRAFALQSDLEALLAVERGRIVGPDAAGRGLPAALRVGLEAHPAERTVEVFAVPEAHAPWTPWARAGVAAFLEVPLDASTPEALAVPRTAVVRDGLEHVVFRAEPDEPDHVERVPVGIGLDDGRFIEIRSGLALGDRIVTQGAWELQLALERGDADQAPGHVHADGTSH